MKSANPNEVQKRKMKCKTDILRKNLVNADNSEIILSKDAKEILDIEDCESKRSAKKEDEVQNRYFEKNSGKCSK